jgi:hypothetical protein
VTLFAEFDFPAHSGDCFTKLDNGIFFLFEQVKNQPQSCFFTYSGQLREFLNRGFKQV